MKSISKTHLTRINTLVDELDGLSGEVCKAIEDFNDVLGEHRSAIETAITNYNEKIAELREIYQEAAQEAQDYFEERSEKWQDGEAGQQYSSWKEQLDGVADTLEDLEAIDLDDIEEPDSLFDSEQWERPADSASEL